MNAQSNQLNSKSKTPNYSLTEQIYESADKHIRIYKSRKKFTVLYIAVKQYSKKVHENCEYEYNILKNLKHPNLVKVLGYTEDLNYFNMEMEFCVTQDLSKAIWQNRFSQYSEKSVKHVGTQIMLSLRYLHKNNILHCNLKPSNILVDDYGNIRLCDFKKALLINKVSSVDIKKNKSAMTPCYTAPELFSETGVYDNKTDIWAMGCIIYELATGQVPFFDESVNKLMYKIINDSVNFNKKELSKFSDDCMDLIKGLLEKDPEKRMNWNEIERHPFWELQNTELENERLSTGRLANKNDSKIGNNVKNNTDIDINTLSKNAVKNYLEDNSDGYRNSNTNNKNNEDNKEVGAPDQEFKFEGDKKDDNDDYDGKGDENYDKFIKLKNPLEVSVLNISTVFQREKRTNNNKIKKHHEINDKNFDSQDLEEADIDNLLLHNSDKIIKPIIGNKLIETLAVTTYNKSLIPMQIWRVDKIKELLKQNNIKPVESYLLGIYSLMENYYNSKNNEENLLNILNYFETIIQDKEIANKIINTSFITLLILVLKNMNGNKQVCYLIRIRICMIIAFLIRYSTMIETPLDDLGLCSILEHLVQNGNSLEMIKKAIATLGEYLFFVATQAEGEEVVSNWIVSKESLNTLLYALEVNTDEIVKFYALKAIENISALTSVAEMYFASDKFLIAIIEVYLTAKLHELRITAAYTMSHLIRLNPKLFEVFISKLNFSIILVRINNEVPKIQQALINCLIFGAKEYGISLMSDLNKLRFINNDQYIDAIKRHEFGAILVYLIENIESCSSILKTKIILLFKYLITDIPSIIVLDELKLFPLIINKLKKDPQLEIRQGIKFFEDSLQERVSEFVKSFKLTLQQFISSFKNNKKVDFLSLISTLTSCLKVFTILSTFTKLSFTMFSKDFLDNLIEILYNNELIKEAEIQEYLFSLLMKFSENKNLVEDNSDYVISKMTIPILQMCLIDKLENKIIPLTITANIITMLLDDEKLYSSTVLDEGKTKLINSLIIEILPILYELLNSEELVYSSLSFLCLIIERNSAFVQYYKTGKIVDRIFTLMQDPNLANNLNIIKILIKVTETYYTTFDEIIKMNLIDRVNTLINNDLDKTIYTELVIELFYDLMLKINEEKKNVSNKKDLDTNEYMSFLKKVEKVSVNFKLCIKLLGHENSNIQEKSCVCLIFILQLLGATYVESTKINVRFKSTDIPDLLKGIEYNCTKIHKRMIRIFKWIIEYQDDASSVLLPSYNYIVSYVENICNTSTENEVVQLGKTLINVNLKALKK